MSSHWNPLRPPHSCPSTLPVCSLVPQAWAECCSASGAQRQAQGSAIKAWDERGSSALAPATSPQFLEFAVPVFLSWSPLHSWKPGLASGLTPEPPQHGTAHGPST